jgi:type I site-specific restriction endonuclease
LIAVEKGLIVNERPKRADIVVHDENGKPWMIVECKAPEIVLNEGAFYQAANYHLKLQVQYLVITNGIQHYCCKFADGTFRFVEGFPAYNEK